MQSAATPLSPSRTAEGDQSLKYNNRLIRSLSLRLSVNKISFFVNYVKLPRSVLGAASRSSAGSGIPPGSGYRPLFPCRNGLFRIADELPRRRE